MIINITTKNLELTESLENVINKKIGRIQKFTNILQHDSAPKGGKSSAEVFVVVKKETKHHRQGDIFETEATLHLPGKTLVARAHGPSLPITIAEVSDELEIEIRKYKTKTIDLPRRKAQKMEK